MKTFTDQAIGYKGMSVPFTLLSIKENSDNLAIFLPGAGYTVKSPVFHYSEDLYLNKSFDVLQVNYQYNDKIYDDFSKEELSEAIKYDVRTVLDQVLMDTSYKNFYLIGKSLGTIALSTELSRDMFKDAKIVWLTPLIHREDVLKAMVASNHKGLCFIGDNDRCYSEERYNQVTSNPNIVSRLFDKVNHSLEYDNNPVESIDVLKNIIHDMKHF
ncbi:alpha/beta hydrolase [Paenisporosarcina indica]|uniref:alpha/beta hydrolase n=1 Tax=Paenisporosarcina indica TaxID=650093 RepID=UPI000B1E8760|nr:alpha/beta hydrolase [Paenisporosarcina indica]